VVRKPTLGAGRSLGFQSKLLIMLLAVSALSVLIAGAIGYLSGTNSLRNAEYQRLTQLRESRAREITAFYESITDSATVITHSSSTIDAVKAFGPAFAELQKTPLPPGAEDAVSKYFATVFGPKLAEGTGQPSLTGGRLPAARLGAALDAKAMAPSPDLDRDRPAARAALARMAPAGARAGSARPVGPSGARTGGESGRRA
jgi:hypothetical protein